MAQESSELSQRSQSVATPSRAPRPGTTATVRRSPRTAPASVTAAAVHPREHVAPASSIRSASPAVSARASASSVLPAPPRITRPPRVPRARSASLPQQGTLDLAPALPASPAVPATTPRAPRPAAPTIPATGPSTRVRPEQPRPTRPAPPRPPMPELGRDTGLGAGSSSATLGRQIVPYSSPQTATLPDPDVWLVAVATPGGGLRSLEGADRAGAIRVSRPYGHLRSLRPVMPPDVLAAGATGFTGPLAATGETGELQPRTESTGRRSHGLGSGVLATDPTGTRATRLPAERLKPAIVSSVEIETDAGVFRVERPDSVLGHSDLAWALANLEAGEPDSLVPMPRRQLALLLTLLPTAEDPEHPEQDSVWGWAHRLKAPWERGPLHPRGKLGRLIAVDPDPSNRGMHRACFEILGTEEAVWALGVPCYRTGSVYELVPLRRSRWLSWPLTKTRSKSAAATEKPEWEIARVVFRVGAPRWPLAGVVEPLGPLGVAG